MEDFAVAQVPISSATPNEPISIQDGQQTEPPVLFRITWGGGERRQWTGRMALEGGSFSELRVADVNTDSPGSVWLEDGCVEIVALSPRSAESIELSTTQRDGTLAIELSPGADAAPLHARVSLADAERSPVLLKLDEHGNTLRVELAPRDAIQIVTKKTPLIFNPGEVFSFTIEPALTEAVAGTTLDFDITLSHVGNQDTLWRDESRLEIPVEGSPAQVVDIPMPSAEGVYAIRVAAKRPPGFGKRFLPGAITTLAERTFQVVVLDVVAASATHSTDWHSVLEIDPANPRWWERLPTWTQLRRIPGLNRGPLGSVRASAIEHPLGRFVELPHSVTGVEPHWQAYSLPLEAIGVPHVLEIEYPNDEEQHLGISIIEPKTSAAVDGIIRDAGVYVEGLGRSEATTQNVHRLVFWPQTQAPLLLLSNQHPTNPARFGHIRVLKCDSDQLPAVASSALGSDRWLAAYIARPLLAESFGLSGKQSTSQHFSQPFESIGHDWHAHYASAKRLAEYLLYAGFNSAVVSFDVVFPASKNGGNGLDSMDVRNADGLELLLRVFDKKQLALWPSLEFAAPMPELEAIRRASDPQTSGLEWIGPDGRTWLQTYGPTEGRAPYYNLLDARVQKAIIEKVNDVLANYGNHPALAGVAVQLSSHGYAQLPPPEWGLDDATVSRFEREAGIEIGGVGPERFRTRYELIAGQHSDAWRAWRAARLTEFYERLAVNIRRSNSERRLLLTTEDSLAHPSMAVRVRPNLLDENRVRAALLDAGIHQEWLGQVPGIVFCPTNFVGPNVPLRDRAIEFEINEALAESHRSGEPPAGPAVMLYHRPRVRRFASLAGPSPFRFASDAVQVCQPLAQGFAARQSYVNMLAQGDFTVLIDGGNLLPIGQEDVLRDLRLTVQRLPVNAKVTQLEQQPIIVRTYNEPTGITLLVMNTSPWKTDATIFLSGSQTAEMEPLVAVGPDGKEKALIQVLPGKFPWKLSLEPYGVEAVRLAAADVKVVDVQATVSDAAKAELEDRIMELTKRDTNSPRLYPRPVNPSFESIDANATIAGWSLIGEPETVQADLDATAPHHGKGCAHLSNRGRFAVLESDPFPVPPTGQLAMTVFLRGSSVQTTNELRIIVEADQPGRPYRRSISVGSLPTCTYPINSAWRPYPLLVNDLPLESGAMMRVKFEMVGSGEVWIDELATYDLLFPLPFYKFQQAESLRLVKLKQAAHSSQEAGRITDCVRLLESYWPRFLMAYTPAAETAPKQIATSPPPTNPKEEARPGVGERLKGLFKLR
jgi:hypothetical protein